MADVDHGKRTARVALLPILGWVLIGSSIAAGLRALWLDEVYAIVRSQVSLADILALTREAEGNPPLYLILMHFWAAFGDSPLAVRALSIGCALIATWLVFSIGQILASSRYGLMAAGVFAISNVQFYYAHEARTYMLCLTLSLLASRLMIEHFLQPSEHRVTRRLVLAGYCAFTVASGYAHYYAWLNVTAQILTLTVLSAISRGEARRRFWQRTFELLGAGLVALTLYVPEILALSEKASGFFQVIGDQEFRSGVHQVLPDLANQDRLNRWLAFASGFQWRPFNHAGFAHACTAAAIFLSLSAAGSVVKRMRASSRLTVAAVMVGGMAIFPWILIITIPFSPHRFECKHLLFALPWFCLALSLSAATARNRWNFWLLPIGVFSVLNIYASSQMLVSEKEDWPAAWELISKSARPGDLLLTSPLYMRVPLTQNRPDHAPPLQPLYASEPDQPSIFAILAPGAKRKPITQRSPEEWIREAVGRGSRVFVLRGWSNVAVADPKLHRRLRSYGLTLQEPVTRFYGGAGSGATMLGVGRYGPRQH